MPQKQVVEVVNVIPTELVQEQFAEQIRIFTRSPDWSRDRFGAYC